MLVISSAPSRADFNTFQPPDSPSNLTARELCFTSPLKAYTAFDRTAEDPSVGERTERIVKKGESGNDKYWNGVQI